MAKKFRKVRKTKKGTPLKYLSGARNRSAVEKEIKRTARLYKAGKLTPAMMDKISKKRVASAKKKNKKKR